MVDWGWFHGRSSNGCSMLMNLYKTFHLCHYIFLLLLFFVCWIQYMILTIDWLNSNNVFFLALILASSKVLSFHNELQNVGTNFLTLTTRILHKSAIFNWYSGCIFHNIQDWLQEHILSNYYWYIYSSQTL